MKKTIHLSAPQHFANIEIEFTQKKGKEDIIGRTIIRRTIDLLPCPDYTDVSFSGVVGGSREGFFGIFSTGQCAAEINDLFGAEDDVGRLLDLWNRWHLNGMRAGTKAQKEALNTSEFLIFRQERNSGQYGSHYEDACEFLATKNLNPDRGYRYGSKWLVEIVPDEVLKEIETLADKLNKR